ncbi:LUD domain-containing protein [Haloarcula marina]|uniref:LUD domain-containing protein n=1 Tax=Haloarcula marina TaxID=2961574 RepID=UPI0020B6FC71|nr:LUD domain-containing protein [Halomicroarcula marina]
MTESRSAFETSLDELSVTVTRTEESTIAAALTEAVVDPAVGVSLGDAFGSDGFTLADAGVSVDPTPVELREATTGVTAADLAVSDYGSLVLTLDDRASELVSLFVERHVALVRASDVVDDMDTAIETLDATFNRTGGSAVLATGPSATADMGALVQGAHGPETVHVVIIEEGA